MCDDLPIPSARELFQGSRYITNIVISVFGSLIFLITLFIYLEFILFIHSNFQLPARQTRTAWILALYPVFSFCSLVAVIVPRSAVIVDLVMDVFLASCLYQFLLLLIDYIGDIDRVWQCVKDTDVHINTPPLCCCCVCLPTVTFTKRFLKTLKVMVMQVTIIRPILSFIVAVLWADGLYIPGYISSKNAYIFVIIINLASSSTAVWGLFLLRTAFHMVLKPYQAAGKFMAIQFVILLTIIPSLVISVLVSTDVIPCIDILPSKARGDRIHHGFVICLMLPLLILARHFYRRKQEGGCGSKVMDSGENVNKEHVTGNRDVQLKGLCNGITDKQM